MSINNILAVLIAILTLTTPVSAQSFNRSDGTKILTT
jgi:hypothetical protein